MATVNGSAINPFGGADSFLQIVYTVTQSAADKLANRSSVSWQLRFRYGNAHIRLDNAQCAFGGGTTSGDANGGPKSTGWPAPGGPNTTITLDTGAFTIQHNSSGQRTMTITGSVSTDWGSSTINTSVALPQIPQSPAAPDSAAAARVSDAQIQVTWDNNSTSSAPYANVKVYRQVDGGGWALRATLGVVESYNDTGVSANHQYRYRMSAVGQNGAEVGFATSNNVWTTPGAPTNCVATKLANGNIRVSWSNHVNYSEYTTRIEHSADGGPFSELSSVAGDVSSYIHVSPDAGDTHRYRVRARSNTGSLNSAYSANSNTIVLLATANPPTNLSPSGTARDADDDIILTWQHNPADGTPQKSYRIRYEVDGGDTQTIGPETSGDSFHTLAGETLDNGHTITWRVATAGENGTLSSNSADASFDTSAKPTVTIDVPGATYNSSQLTVEWTYFQADASAQAGWQASLYDSDNNLLEQRSGTTEEETTFSTALADSATYTVEVTVTSEVGVTSTPDSQEFTVTYLPPAAASIAASFDTGSGVMVLTVTGSPDEEDVTAPIATVDLQRSIDGGAWVTFAAGIVLDPVTLTATVIDTAPILVGTNTYRAVAHSDLPSSGLTNEVAQVLDGGDGWAFLSTGDGFETVVRLRDSLRVGGGTERAKQLHRMAGRPKPVQLSGEATDLALQIGCDLWLDSPASRPEEFEEIGQTAGIVLWRDPTGRRVFGSISNMTTGREDGLLATVAFTVTEVDHTE